VKEHWSFRPNNSKNCKINKPPDFCPATFFFFLSLLPRAGCTSFSDMFELEEAVFKNIKMKLRFYCPASNFAALILIFSKILKQKLFIM
jgi:hypothetical protein